MRCFAPLLLVAVIAAFNSTAASELSLTLLSQQLPQGGNGQVKIAVVDAGTGKPVPSEAIVSLKSLGSVTDVRSIEEPMTRLDDGTWAVELFKQQKQLGTYTLVVSASSGGSRGSLTADVVITGRVEVSDMKAEVETVTSRDTQKLTMGQPLPEALSLPASFTAKALFTFTVTQSDGAGFSPHQAMVRAVHVESGVTVLVRGRAADDGYHRATLSAADINAQAEGRGGVYDLTLLVADAAIVNPTQWTFGKIDVTADSQLWKGQPTARPEIHHVFRKPDKRTHPVIPVFFAILQVAALGVLLAALWHITGARLGALPQTAGGWAAAAAFHGCLAAVLLLLLAFWVNLTILEMLPLMAVIGPLTAGSGYLLLSHLATSQFRDSRSQLKTE